MQVLVAFPKISTYSFSRHCFFFVQARSESEIKFTIIPASYKEDMSSIKKVQ